VHAFTIIVHALSLLQRAGQGEVWYVAALTFKKTVMNDNGRQSLGISFLESLAQ
jgi:hypothetical protein